MFASNIFFFFFYQPEIAISFFELTRWRDHGYTHVGSCRIERWCLEWGLSQLLLFMLIIRANKNRQVT